MGPAVSSVTVSSLLRKKKTDNNIGSRLLSTKSKQEFSPRSFDAALGLKPVSTKRASLRQLQETLGSFEEDTRSMRGVKSLSRQLNMLLPFDLPPSIFEPLEYILSRIVHRDLVAKKWPFDPMPTGDIPLWANSLLRLHIVSEVTGSRPWWIPALNQAVSEWEDRDPSTLGDLIVKTVSQGINVLIAPQVVNLLGKLARSSSPRLGDLNRYSSGGGMGQHFHSAMSFSIQECFLPSFRRLGISRCFSLKPLGKRTYEQFMQTNPAVTASFGIVGDEAGIDDIVYLERNRTSLRPSLLDASSGSWRTFLDFDSNPPVPTSESSWLIAEEHMARKELRLNERESQVLAAGWAFAGSSSIRESMLESLGLSTHNSRAAARSMLKRSVFTLHYLPNIDLCGLPDKVLVLIEGKQKDLVRIREQIEAGTPYCRSMWFRDKKGMVIEIRTSPYSSPILQAHLQRELRQRGYVANAYSIARTNSFRFSSLLKTLPTAK